MATKRRADVDDAVIDAIRQAPADKTNAALAKKYGITPQYVSLIRRGRVVPKSARLDSKAVDARVLEIAGDSGVTAKRAKAVELLFDAILLELDDIKLQERQDSRAKRLSVISRALKDASDCAASLRRASALEAMTDEELRAALAAMAGGAAQ